MSVNIATAAIIPSSTRAVSNIAAPGKAFLANTFIQPDYDRIRYFGEESGRLQFCIPEEWLKLIRMAASMLTCKPWRRDPEVCARRAGVMYRVVKTNYGYRALQHSGVGTGWNVLGDELGELPLLFPTAESAITATDVIIQIEPLKRPELWRLTWLKPTAGLCTVSN